MQSINVGDNNRQWYVHLLLMLAEPIGQGIHT